MNILVYPMVYYANTFQPILTYMQTEFSLDYEMGKKTSNYPMHVPRFRDVRCRHRCHMGALPLSAKVK